MNSSRFGRLPRQIFPSFKSTVESQLPPLYLAMKAVNSNSRARVPVPLPEPLPHPPVKALICAASPAVIPAAPAADAVGANSLLTYVGGLYHDIGKMNKPEYFIENRVGGGNRHDKLSPALSLLVIVGHVKDGVELAIEFGIPKVLRHFIEAHHGTTLVEYFFHRAKQKAKAAAAQEDSEIGDLDREEDDSELDGMPDEVEYRYPGPRPQTKEVAILMVSDAVESATRTLEDPTPARIETLVRDLANKRLLDGQFDDCELTLRELNQICESIARTVTSIYHGRVAYPSEKRA